MSFYRAIVDLYHEDRWTDLYLKLMPEIQCPKVIPRMQVTPDMAPDYRDVI